MSSSSQPHTFATLPVEVRLQGLCVFLDTKSLANLSLTCKDMYNTINSFKPLQIRRQNASSLQFYLRYMQKAHPSCIKRSFAPEPGEKYPLRFDRVEICDTNFTICLRYRVDVFVKHNRAVLLADWHSGSWSFIMFHDSRGPNMELRRNINSRGSDPKQGMVHVSANAIDNDNAPSRTKYHTVAFTWNRENGGLFSVLYDKDYHNFAKPFAHVTEKELVVQRSTTPHFYVGWKNDDPSETLEGDVSHLAIFGRAMLPNEAQHVLSSFEKDAVAVEDYVNRNSDSGWPSSFVASNSKANWVDLQDHGYGQMYTGCQ